MTVFQFDVTKHADRLQKRIRDFVGILVCDAESRNAAGAPGVPLSNCNAHPLRKFRDAERVQPRLALQGARFLRALYELEDEADRLALAGAERVAFRQRRSGRVLRRFRQWLEGVLARPLPPSDPVRKVASYYLTTVGCRSPTLAYRALGLCDGQIEPWPPSWPVVSLTVADGQC